jgi:hypothetical protein
VSGIPCGCYVCRNLRPLHQHPSLKVRFNLWMLHRTVSRYMPSL